jgi:glycosyltransferase involved in cell wall biosynthesis
MQVELGSKASSTEGSGMPLVSVVIIFLNAARFMREAIESVRGQTYENWELLLVDDGSTDASTAIAKSYEACYPARIRYLEHSGHDNRGMSASRNLGICHASGELIALLDADDVWMPEKLQRQVAIMEGHRDVGLLAHPALYWYQDGLRKVQDMTLPAGRLPRGAWVPMMLESDDNAACPSTVLMRKSLAIRLGGFEESFRGSFEDQAMWFKVTLESSIYYDPDCLILYRIHADACCSATPSLKQLEARVNLYSWLSTYLRDACHERWPPRSMQIMARSKLCDSLLRFATKQTGVTDDPVASSRGTRLRESVRLARSHLPALGCLFATLVVVGAISARTASSVSQQLFRRARAAYAAATVCTVVATPRHEGARSPWIEQP